MKTWGKFCPKLLFVSAKGKGAVWAVSGVGTGTVRPHLCQNSSWAQGHEKRGHSSWLTKSFQPSVADLRTTRL